jgi:hypothetical protein
MEFAYRTVGYGRKQPPESAVKGFEHLHYISLAMVARLLGRSHVWAWRQARYGKFGPLVRIRKEKHPYVGLLELEKRFGPFSDEEIAEAIIAVHRNEIRRQYYRVMMRREEEWKKFCLEKLGYNGPSWPAGPTFDEGKSKVVTHASVRLRGT